MGAEIYVEIKRIVVNRPVNTNKMRMTVGNKIAADKKKPLQYREKKMSRQKNRIFPYGKIRNHSIECGGTLFCSIDTKQNWLVFSRLSLFVRYKRYAHA